MTNVTFKADYTRVRPAGVGPGAGLLLTRQRGRPATGVQSYLHEAPGCAGEVMFGGFSGRLGIEGLADEDAGPSRLDQSA
jgi:hypothetical protein